jgi:hypothetical protein
MLERSTALQTRGCNAAEAHCIVQKRSCNAPERTCIMQKAFCSKAERSGVPHKRDGVMQAEAAAPPC